MSTSSAARPTWRARGQSSPSPGAPCRTLTPFAQGADANALVFGLSASQIHRRLKAAAQAAGLGDGFSGHSGRVGMATRMTRLGAPMPVVMRQGRWVSSRMPARYVRNESASAALAYLC